MHGKGEWICDDDQRGKVVNPASTSEYYLNNQGNGDKTITIDEWWNYLDKFHSEQNWNDPSVSLKTIVKHYGTSVDGDHVVLDYS